MEQCIIEYDGSPIRYCLFYTLDAGYYKVHESQYERFVGKQDVVYGVDIFIGEAAYRNRGIGTTSLKALFGKRDADMLVIDSKTARARAIWCYYK